MISIHPGIVVTATIDREVDYGYFLVYENESFLLHHNEVIEDVQLGDEIEVFLYTDKQNRMAATMTIPEITTDSYGWSTVKEVKDGLGVFVSIGIQKDILVSEDDLPLFRSVWPNIGDQLYITLTVDKKGRLLAVPATESDMEVLMIEAPENIQNRNVEGTVFRIAKAGATVITIEGYRGFIHPTQMKEEPRLGEHIKGRVIGVKPDGSVNISLLPRKQEGMEDDAEALLLFMEKRGGGMPYSDKSDPEDISLQFGMSKGAFKRAIGSLMKNGKAYQADGWTYLKE